MSRLKKDLKAIPVIVTPQLLRISMPQCKEPEKWAEAFNRALYDYPVTNIAMLLAQVGHESADLNRLEENMNYSATRLMQVWPKRFPTLEAARPYANNPVALANHTYGGRLGNTMKGDGWKYRGQGPIQYTGRYNFAELQRLSGMPVITHPELLVIDKECGAISSCVYFRTRVTSNTVSGVTRQIQGGQLGLKDRQDRYDRTVNAM